jgi:hypothetical protein
VRREEIQQQQQQLKNKIPHLFVVFGQRQLGGGPNDKS